MTETAYLATDTAHYDRIGITTEIKAFEDGLRTDPEAPGTYEWWYFDAHLDNGAKLVIAFHAKDFAAPTPGLNPIVSIDIDLPDGRRINKRQHFDPAEFAASADTCDVRVSNNRFRGDLHAYTIHAQVDDVVVDVELTGVTEPWRPATGYTYYGDDGAGEFAWLPAVPHGAVSATYRVGDESVTSAGHGYHDHNWGNVPLQMVVNNWYWGRGSVGPYTFITAQIVNEKEYGYEPVTIFMVAKDGRVIADDHSNVTFSKSGVSTDEKSGKPVADKHSFAYQDGDSFLKIAYERRSTVLHQFLADSLPADVKEQAVAGGYDGAYLRFDGTVHLTRRESGQPTEELAADAIWELMYFGKHQHEMFR